MNRRNFIQSLAAAVPVCRFPSVAGDRLAVASYPFSKELDLQHATMKLLDFPLMVVERFRVRGIEPLDRHFASTDPDYLARFREVLNKVGAHVVNIPIGQTDSGFYNPDDAKRNAAIAHAKHWIDVAAAIKSPSIRAHIEQVHGVSPDLERAASALKEVAAYGREKGIIVNLENDDKVSEDAFFIVGILNRVRSPWLRALPDFGNSQILGKGDDYNYRAVTAMFQHACNISHVKEVETDDGKTYRVDLARTFAIARRARYSGYFSIEWDSDGDPYHGTEHLIDRCRQILT